jgi:hypothetical protein
MRKQVAIALLSVFLFSNTSLRELLKVGVFFQHFQEHKAQDSEISLVDFIIIHYFSGNIQDEDYDRDMQLPFKMAQNTEVGSSITLPNTDIPALQLPALPQKETILPVSQSAEHSLHCSDIWQPPKCC